MFECLTQITFKDLQRDVVSPFSFSAPRCSLWGASHLFLLLPKRWAWAGWTELQIHKRMRLYPSAAGSVTAQHSDSRSWVDGILRYLRDKDFGFNRTTGEHECQAAIASVMAF